MAHQYKVGDKVRIKKREGAALDYPFCFASIMADLEGKIFTIKSIIPHDKSEKFFTRKYNNGDYNCYTLEGCSLNWHSSMFEPVVENPESQTSISLEEGDSIPICGMIGKIRHCNVFKHPMYYLDFAYIDDQEHFTCCMKLRELVPNFDKIADEYNPIRYTPGCFPEFSTISDLVKFIQVVNNAYNSKKSTITPKTLNENEIRFQKQKVSSIRGSVPTGRAICGRRRKTAIEFGHLSNTACYC